MERRHSVETEDKKHIAETHRIGHVEKTNDRDYEVEER